MSLVSVRVDDGVAEVVGDGLAEPLALGVAAAGAVYVCASSTGRNASLAVELTKLMTSFAA